MLNSEIIKKIEDFVYLKPRSMQEIAQHLKKNWRTVDRYIKEIKENFGTIDMRTFREGTRGALKIVYWASIEKVSHSIFQEQLEKDIFSGRNKEEFSVFDIFQYIKDKNKKAIIEKSKKDEVKNMIEYSRMIKETKTSILIFSGNLSFINLKDIMKVFENLIKRKISIKVICRVDIVGKKNVEKLLSLNFKYGKELIEIHHREQPLRVTMIDNKIINIKEIKEPTGRKKELNQKTFIFYTIKNKDWAEWLSRIFWKMFSSSIGAEKRLNEIGKIK